jgi:pimeloyl-ACP methyl ester carboxylesterase
MSVAVSEEQFATVSDPAHGELQIAFQTFGDASDEPLLLIMGLGGPMTWWDPTFCSMLAERGFFVIRFDNRDIGRSTRLQGRVTIPMLVQGFLGRPVPTPYSLRDMAADAVGILDHLGLASAHVCGVSMGGMIAQTMAIEFGDRVRSLVSIMSTTGNRRVGWQHPKIFPTLLQPAGSREDYLRASERVLSRIASTDYPMAPEYNRNRAEVTWDRGVNPAGVGRQMLAIITQPDRTKALGQLRMPVSVIHGLSDVMVNVSGGRATSRAIPGSELLLIKGMGHDIPAALWPTFVSVIRRTATRAATAESAA